MGRVRLADPQQMTPCQAEEWEETLSEGVKARVGARLCPQSQNILDTTTDGGHHESLG